MAYFILLILWILWCIFHSLLITPVFVSFVKGQLGSAFKYYRLIYNCMALLTILPIAAYGRSLDSPIIISWHGPAVIFQVLLFISALLFFAAGAAKYDLGQFLGTAQIKSGRLNTALSESGGLDTGGILQVTRHPWYLGALCIIWSYQVEIDLQSLYTNLVLTIYLVVGTLLEERKLKAQFGNEYRRYAKEVSMLFPYKWFSKLLRARIIK